MYANPVTYVAGLLHERAGAVQAGRKAIVAEIDAELAAARKALEQIDIAELEKDAKAELAAVRRSLGALDKAPKAAAKPDDESTPSTEAAPGAEPADAPEPDAPSGKKAAKAAPPPRTA